MNPETVKAQALEQLASMNEGVAQNYKDVAVILEQNPDLPPIVVEYLNLSAATFESLVALLIQSNEAIMNMSDKIDEIVAP